MCLRSELLARPTNWATTFVCVWLAHQLELPWLIHFSIDCVLQLLLSYKSHLKWNFLFFFSSAFHEFLIFCCWHWSVGFASWCSFINRFSCLFSVLDRKLSSLPTWWTLFFICLLVCLSFLPRVISAAHQLGQLCSILDIPTLSFVDTQLAFTYTNTHTHFFWQFIHRSR